MEELGSKYEAKLQGRGTPQAQLRRTPSATNTWWRTSTSTARTGTNHICATTTKCFIYAADGTTTTNFFICAANGTTATAIRSVDCPITTVLQCWETNGSATTPSRWADVQASAAFEDAE